MQTLDLDDRRMIAAWAAEVVDGISMSFSEAVPDDPRVASAIEQTRAFASGKLGAAEAIRRRGAQAGAAARDAPTPAATAAAYAAE